VGLAHVPVPGGAVVAGEDLGGGGSRRTGRRRRRKCRRKGREGNAEAIWHQYSIGSEERESIFLVVVERGGGRREGRVGRAAPLGFEKCKLQQAY